MKFIHLSDLHIGKSLNGFSLLEDQKYILEKIYKIIVDEGVEGVFIAGDVYDKSIPSAEAVHLLDDFLVKLCDKNRYVFIISGNHDSIERLSFASKLLRDNRLYISEVYDKNIEPIKIKDGNNTISVFLLPFIKPINVRNVWDIDDIKMSYDDALKYAISKLQINKNDINVILSHQFVTGAKTSDSEEATVGGLDNVEATAYDPFDYVALGHIHTKQHISRETLCYCGTPLKYSFSEVNIEKSAVIVDIKAKNDIHLKSIPLTPIRDMRVLKGKYNDITSRDYYIDTNTEDYVKAVLTDDIEVPEAINRLRQIYPNIMALEYKNKRSAIIQDIDAHDVDTQISPFDFYSQLHEAQNNTPMTLEQREYINNLIQSIWEGEV